MKILAIIVIAGLIPITSNGQITFEKTFGIGSNNESGYAVQQTTDGGYIITATTDGDNSSPRIYLIKTDSFGDSVWTKTYAGLGTASAYSGQQTADGGYIITGETYGYPNGGVLLLKTDPNGDAIWSKAFGNPQVGMGSGSCVQQTSDGGYIIVGYTEGENDVYLIKTDNNGNSLWQKIFGEGIHDRGNFVQQTTDGGYIIGGETLTDTGNYWDIYLVKTDATGNIIWEKTFGGPDLNYGYWVQQTNDGGYIVSGYSFENGGMLIKTDEHGNSVWIKTFGEVMRYANSVKQTDDNGFIITGTGLGVGLLSDLILIRTDSDGNILWEKTFGGEANEDGFCVNLTNDGGYIITGATGSFGAIGWDVYLVKTAPDSVLGIKDAGTTGLNINVYPNPNDGHFFVSFNPSATNITFQVTNSLGAVIKTLEQKMNGAVQIDLTNAPQGIYFMNVLSKETIIVTKKIVTY